MEKQKRFLILDFEPTACICLAAAVLFIPLCWIVSWMIAAAVHELCHFCAIALTGGKVRNFSIGIRGAVIQADIQSGGREGVCAIAGPLGGLLLIPFARWAPRLALCALIQSSWNLMPVYPLDGGRALTAFLQRFMPQYADCLVKFITVAVLCIFCAASIYATVFLRLGLAPLFLAIGILLKTGKIKIPCKRGRLRVQ